GAERFGDITARLVGHKLATLLGGEVKVAPVINTPIRGGRAVISMTSEAPATMERESFAIAAALTVVAPPPGGVIEDERWIAPASAAGSLALARIAIGLVAAVLIGSLVGFTVRVARPVWQPVVQRPGRRFLVWRVAVTLLAPFAVVALGQVSL